MLRTLLVLSRQHFDANHNTSFLCILSNRLPVSSVGRAPVCWAGGRDFKPRPDHQPRSLKNWWDHASCKTPFSVQMIASLGGDLVSFILVLQLEGDVKEPVTLFEKSRGRRLRCHSLSNLCRHRSGWARCDQNVDWSSCKSAPLHADIRYHLSGSSAIHPLAVSEESGHRLSTSVYYLWSDYHYGIQ